MDLYRAVYSLLCSGGAVFPALVEDQEVGDEQSWVHTQPRSDNDCIVSISWRVTEQRARLQRAPAYLSGHLVSKDTRVWETAPYNAVSILNGFLSKEWTQRWFRISATYENNLNVMKNCIDHSMEITKRVVPGVESNSQPCDCVSHAYGMYYYWICMVPRLITKNPYFRSHSLCDDMFDWF